MEPMYLIVERESGDTYKESDAEDPSRGASCAVFQTEETAEWAMQVTGDSVRTLPLEPEELARKLADDTQVVRVVYWYGFPMQVVYGGRLGGQKIMPRGEFLEFLAGVDE